MIQLIDISQEVTFAYFNESCWMWQEKTCTIKELLEILTDYKRIKIYNLNTNLWGDLFEDPRQ